MTTRQISCLNEAETAALARDLALAAQPGDIYLLEGDLGAGKTAFSRAFIRALNGDMDLNVPSPTFTLVQVYETSKAPIHHFDLYRLKDADEIFEIGWEDALAGGIALVEWPDRLAQYRPKRALEIQINHVAGQPEHRIITITDKKAA
jgi:tRNA threonylcarbamoyl adenosine modification protein YjeE